MFGRTPRNACQRSLKSSEEKRQNPMSQQKVNCPRTGWLVVGWVIEMGDIVSSEQGDRIVSKNDLERFHVKACVSFYGLGGIEGRGTAFQVKGSLGARDPGTEAPAQRAVLELGGQDH